MSKISGQLCFVSLFLQSCGSVKGTIDFFYNTGAKTQYLSASKGPVDPGQ